MSSNITGMTAVWGMSNQDLNPQQRCLQIDIEKSGIFVQNRKMTGCKIMRSSLGPSIRHVEVHPKFNTEVRTLMSGSDA